MSLLASYFHDFNPIVVRISGDLAIRWYGLSYTAGFIVAGLVWYWMARRRPPLTLVPAPRVLDALLIVIIGLMVGGRLGYAIVYGRELLYTFHASFPFWDLLAINKGGMASHGAMVGLALAAVWVARRFGPPDPLTGAPRPMPVAHITDVLCLLTPVGIMLGRFANFVNGELLGRIVSPPGTPGGGPWWSVQFPQELLGWAEVTKNQDGQPVPRELVRSLDSHAPELSTQQIAQLDQLVQSVQVPGQTWNGALRALVEHAGQHRAQLEPLVSARHPSQLYQALAEGLIVGAICWLIRAAPRKPGVITGWWLIAYGALRIATEFWRLPDAKFGSSAHILGLSRGQWLSAGMIAVGAWVLVWSSRRVAERLGGWWRSA